MCAPPNDSVLPHLRHPFSKASSDTESTGGPLSIPWEKNKMENSKRYSLHSPTKILQHNLQSNVN